MKLAISTFLLGAAMTAATTVATQTSSTLSLMPMPAELTATEGVYEVGPEFSVNLDGPGATPRLHRGVQHMLRRLADRSALFFPPDTFLNLDGSEGAAMKVTVERAGELRLGEDESYELVVSPEGIVLTATTDLGALRGLETVLQLLSLDERGIVLPSVHVVDSPRFPWRGLMIDASRHFMPVEMVKRNLDGMAAVKLNVMHWHLADDQGFRVECLSYPKLHELGADFGYYSRAQIRDVIDHAAERGIRVVPEFDLPGHATSWLTAYPEYASQPGPYEIERSWGIFKPTVNPTIEATYEFLDSLFGEMAELFDDDFLHIGGDENTGEDWMANPEIVAFMKANDLADAHELQRYFSSRLEAILAKHGKRMVGWDEILQPGLPKTAVIQSWRGREALADAARQGYSGMLSNGYYIDLIQSTELHYLNDPLPEGTDLSPEEQARVLGGEATMWAEYVSPETVDSRIWPRTAAIAERLWSPAEVRDVKDMYRRLDRISLMLEELGLQHERNRPAMLRRLCQCRDVAPLEVLLGAIEPVKVYNRGRLRKHTQLSPLTRMVDAAWPDAAPARELRWAVDHLIDSGFSDEEAMGAVRSTLRQWQTNHGAFVEIARSSPALTEMEEMSLNLGRAATAGLEALSAISSGTLMGNERMSQCMATLKEADESHGQTELVILDTLRRLVCHAAGDPAGCMEKEVPVAKGGGHD